MRKFAWLVALLFASPLAASDFNKDGAVTFEDFLMFTQRYGASAGDEFYAPEFDLDNSGEIVKCCGWGGAHPDGLSGGFNVSVLKFDALDDEFNEFVAV